MASPKSTKAQKPSKKATPTKAATSAAPTNVLSNQIAEFQAALSTAKNF